MALSCERIERCDRGDESPVRKRTPINYRPSADRGCPPVRSNRRSGRAIAGGLSPKPIQFANQRPGGIEFRGRARPGECAMRATGLQREADLLMARPINRIVRVHHANPTTNSGGPAAIDRLIGSGDRRRRIRTEIDKQRSDSIGGHESLGRLGSQNYIMNDLFARHVARCRPQESGLGRANCCIAMLLWRGGKMKPNRSLVLKDRFNRPIGL
jgi:hypothetical protein